MGIIGHRGEAHSHYCSLPLDGISQINSAPTVKPKRFVSRSVWAANIRQQMTLVGQLARLLRTRS